MCGPLASRLATRLCASAAYGSLPYYSIPEVFFESQMNAPLISELALLLALSDGVKDPLIRGTRLCSWRSTYATQNLPLLNLTLLLYSPLPETHHTHQPTSLSPSHASAEGNKRHGRAPGELGRACGGWVCAGGPLSALNPCCKSWVFVRYLSVGRGVCVGRRIGLHPGQRGA